MADRSGPELAKAIEDGEELTEVERLRVVIALKNQHLDRLADRVRRAMVAVQTGERSTTILAILQGYPT